MIINDVERERSELVSHRTEKLKKKIDADYKIEKYARSYLTTKNKEKEAHRQSKMSEIQHKKETKARYTTGSIIKKEVKLKGKNVYLYNEQNTKTSEKPEPRKYADIKLDHQKDKLTIKDIIEEKLSIMQKLKSAAANMN